MSYFDVKRQFISAGIAILIIGPIFIYVNALLIEPPPTYDLRRKILTPEVYAGGEIEVEFTAVHRNGAGCVVTIEPYMWDSAGVRHEFKKIHRVIKGDGRRRTSIARIVVPKQVPPGDLVYEPVIIYYCNRLQKMSPVTRTDVDPIVVKVLEKVTASSGGSQVAK